MRRIAWLYIINDDRVAYSKSSKLTFYVMINQLDYFFFVQNNILIEEIQVNEGVQLFVVWKIFYLFRERGKNNESKKEIPI